MGNKVNTHHYHYQPTREEIVAGLREKYIKHNINSINVHISFREGPLFEYNASGYTITDYLWLPTSNSDKTLVERKVSLHFDNTQDLTVFILSIHKPYIVESDTMGLPYIYFRFINYPTTQKTKQIKAT